MKNILIIAVNFDPNLQVYNVKRFKYLHQTGWFPIVITNKLKKEENNRIKISKHYKIFQVFCIAKSPFKIFSKLFGSSKLTVFFDKLIFIPDHFIMWLPIILFQGFLLSKKFNIKAIVTVSPPESLHLAGMILSKITGIPLVVDFTDMWTTRITVHKPVTIFHELILTFLEKSILKFSSHIIANTEMNKEIYIDHFKMPSSKITTITLGYDPEELKCNINTVDKSENRYNCCRIGYFGRFDKPWYPWNKFLLALKNVEQLNPGNLLFEVWGDASNNCKNYAIETLPDHAITFHNYMPHNEAFLEVAKCDLLLLLLHDTVDSLSQIPQKLYHYLIMNKPVLAIAPVNGEVARIINKTRTGLTISPERFKMIENFLDSFVKNYKKTNSWFNPDYKEIKKYNICSLAEKFDKVFCSCTKRDIVAISDVDEL